MSEGAKNGGFCGVFAVDKPAGFTSFDVVAKLRGVLKMKRIGHGGTLDPMATGVLPIFLGKAARAADLVSDTAKRYTAAARFGLKTDTGDITGRVTERSGIIPDRETLERALGLFTGKITQTPPMYSAVSIGGKRLYELARNGEVVERKPREIEIFSLELLRYDARAGEFEIDVRCSKGTYVRVLAEDIAAAAGGIGTLVSLRRTKSGPFYESGCLELTEIERRAASGRFDFIKPADRLFEEYRAIYITPEQRDAFLRGARVRGVDGAAGEKVRVYCGDAFLAAAELTGNGIGPAVRFV